MKKHVLCEPALERTKKKSEKISQQNHMYLDLKVDVLQLY